MPNSLISGSASCVRWITMLGLKANGYSRAPHRTMSILRGVQYSPPKATLFSLALLLIKVIRVIPFLSVILLGFIRLSSSPSGKPGISQRALTANWSTVANAWGYIRLISPDAPGIPRPWISFAVERPSRISERSKSSSRCFILNRSSS